MTLFCFSSLSTTIPNLILALVCCPMITYPSISSAIVITSKPDVRIIIIGSTEAAPYNVVRADRCSYGRGLILHLSRAKTTFLLLLIILLSTSSRSVCVDDAFIGVAIISPEGVLSTFFPLTSPSLHSILLVEVF
jgi:hypothetical protein